MPAGHTAENGFSVEARFEPKVQPDRDGKPPYPTPELSVFETLDSLFAYLKKMLTEQVEYEKSEG